MPNKKITVSIPKACKVNLDEMQTVANGKFCTHCSKTVWDFRNWSEEELGHFFANSEQLVCGCFAALQLNTPLPVPSQNQYRIIAAAALGFSLFLAQDAVAQHKAPLKPKQNIVAQQKIKSQKLIGHLQDENGNAAASLPVKLFEGSTLVNQVFSDTTGCFELDIPFKQNEKYYIQVLSSRFQPYWKELIGTHFESQLIIKLEIKRIETLGNLEIERVGMRTIYELKSLEPNINENLKTNPNPTYNEQDIRNRGGVDQIIKDIPQR